MSRIIAGAAGGTTLRPVPGDGTRPTTDRTKEALFSWLESRGWLDSTSVLDLFAGSGALGAEAASRGATEVVGVESHRKTASIAAHNLSLVNKALGSTVGKILTTTAEKYLESATGFGWDLILADPPYPMTDEEVNNVIALAIPAMADDGLFVLERGKRSNKPQLSAELELIDERNYGEATVFFIRKRADAS